MAAALPRILRTLALLAWAGVMLGMYFSGRISSYLHPHFRPLVVVAGFVLLIIAVGYWFLASEEGDGCCDHDHDHSHDSEKPGLGMYLNFAIVVFPMLVAYFVSPSYFSPVAMLNRMGSDMNSLAPLPGEKPGRQQTMENPSFIDYLEVNEDGQVVVELIDLMFGVEDSIVRRDFEGREVYVIGQALAADSSNANHDRFRLARMFMWCCAADSRPVTVAVQGVSEPPSGQWVEIAGTMSYPVEGGNRIALIKAHSINEIEPPQESMLY